MDYRFTGIGIHVLYELDLNLIVIAQPIFSLSNSTSKECLL
jgi:hypothetical protein